MLEVYHRAKEVWYHEYHFRSDGDLPDCGGENRVITCQTKAKICLEDIDRTLESFSERSLRAGYEFCYTYSCNIKRSDAFGLDYCITPADSLPTIVKPSVSVVKPAAPSQPRKKKEKKKVCQLPFLRAMFTDGKVRIFFRENFPSLQKIDTDIQVVKTFFHLPMNIATQKLQIGSTALKKICRRYGIMRWPYRRIKAIEKLIQQLEETGACLKTSEGEYHVLGAEGQAIRDKLSDLYAEKEQLCRQGT